jgi:hypothetical protein
MKLIRDKIDRFVYNNLFEVSKEDLFARKKKGMRVTNQNLETHQ